MVARPVIIHPCYCTIPGLHISFLTPTILESSLDVIGSLFPQVHLPFPLLISVGGLTVVGQVHQPSCCQLGNPTRGEGASFNFAIFPVVLDSSEGRSSEPLIDGSEFLEATSKKVSNNTYADHITKYGTYMGHKGSPQFRIFGGEMGFRPGREGGRHRRIRSLWRLRGPMFLLVATANCDRLR